MREGRNIARLSFGVVALVVVVLVFVLVSNIMRAGSGRKMLAVRSNERAAASIGIAVPTIKLGAFASSSFLAGLGGALIGYSRGQLSPASFAVFVGLGFVAIAYLSGITSISGALRGGLAGHPRDRLRDLRPDAGLAGYYAVVSGPLLILTVIFNPVGISGRARVMWDAVGSSGRPRRRRCPAPAHWWRRRRPPPADGARPRHRRRAARGRRYHGHLWGRAGGRSARLNVRAGEIVALIGPNGAGKTSFIDAVTGFTPCAGQVRRPGCRSMDARQRPGPEGAGPHVAIGRALRRPLGRGQRARQRRHPARVWKLLYDAVRPNAPASAAVGEAIALVGLEHAIGRKPSELPLGHQKLVGVARSLALRPKVLLLDEPGAGLDVAEIAAFGRRLTTIAASGVGCLLVDHDMRSCSACATVCT